MWNVFAFIDEITCILKKLKEESKFIYQAQSSKLLQALASTVILCSEFCGIHDGVSNLTSLSVEKRYLINS
jgi:hypothetical protein